MPLADMYLPQKALDLKGRKKIVQVEGKQTSRDKSMITASELPHSKAGKRTNLYLLGLREVLKDLQPAAIALSDRTCPHWEDEVRSTSM